MVYLFAECTISNNMPNLESIQAISFLMEVTENALRNIAAITIVLKTADKVFSVI